MSQSGASKGNMQAGMPNPSVAVLKTRQPHTPGVPRAHNLATCIIRMTTAGLNSEDANPCQALGKAKGTTGRRAWAGAWTRGDEQQTQGQQTAEQDDAAQETQRCRSKVGVQSGKKKLHSSYTISRCSAGS